MKKITWNINTIESLSNIPFKLFSFILILSVLGFAPDLLAQQNSNGNPLNRTYKDWTIVDPEKPGVSCFVIQQVFSKKSGVKLIEASLYPIDAKGAKKSFEAIFALSVPTGADLVSGIAYRHVEGKKTAIGLEWQSCNSSRCTATGKISRKELKRLRREKYVVVGFRPLPTSRVLNVPLSLVGLTRAWRDIGKCGKEKK